MCASIPMIMLKLRLPIRKALLKLLIQQIPFVFLPGEQPYLVRLYMALFTASYFGLFRIGELTASNHMVKANDVQIGQNKNKLMFILRTSKTHGHNKKPQTITIVSKQIMRQHGLSTPRDDFCPFRVIGDYVDVRPARKNNNEQFFVFKDRQPVKLSHFRWML